MYQNLNASEEISNTEGHMVYLLCMQYTDHGFHGYFGHVWYDAGAKDQDF